MERILKRCDGVPFVHRGVDEGVALDQRGLDLPVRRCPCAAQHDVPATLHARSMDRLDRLSDAELVADRRRNRPRVRPRGARDGDGLDELVLIGRCVGWSTRRSDESRLRRRRTLDAFKTRCFAMPPMRACCASGARNCTPDRRHAQPSRRKPAKSVPELLAYHFTEAALTDKAIRSWREAGKQARWRFRSIEAIEPSENARSCWPQHPPVRRVTARSRAAARPVPPGVHRRRLHRRRGQGEHRSGARRCPSGSRSAPVLLVLWSKARVDRRAERWPRRGRKARRLVELAQATGQLGLVRLGRAQPRHLQRDVGRAGGGPHRAFEGAVRALAIRGAPRP